MADPGDSDAAFLVNEGYKEGTTTTYARAYDKWQSFWNEQLFDATGAPPSYKGAFLRFIRKRHDDKKAGSSLRAVTAELSRRRSIALGNQAAYGCHIPRMVKTAWWTHEEIRKAMKGAAKRKGRDKAQRQVIVRCPVTSSMLAVLEAYSARQGRADLGVGMRVLWASVARRTNLEAVTVGHVLIYDADPNYPDTREHAEIWMTNWKGENRDVSDGSWVMVYDPQCIQQLRERKGSREEDEPILPEWDADVAVQIMRACAVANKWPTGLDYGIHALRSGGEQHWESRGVNPQVVCVQGRWTNLMGAFQKNYRPRFPPKLRAAAEIAFGATTTEQAAMQVLKLRPSRRKKVVAQAIVLQRIQEERKAEEASAKAPKHGFGTVRPQERDEASAETPKYGFGVGAVEDKEPRARFGAS